MALRKLAKYLIKHSNVSNEDDAFEIIKDIRKKNNNTLIGLKKVEILSSARKLFKVMKHGSTFFLLLEEINLIYPD